MSKIQNETNSQPLSRNYVQLKSVNTMSKIQNETNSQQTLINYRNIILINAVVIRLLIPD